MINFAPGRIKKDKDIPEGFVTHPSGTFNERFKQHRPKPRHRTPTLGTPSVRATPRRHSWTIQYRPTDRSYVAWDISASTSMVSAYGLDTALSYMKAITLGSSEIIPPPRQSFRLAWHLVWHDLTLSRSPSGHVPRTATGHHIHTMDYSISPRPWHGPDSPERPAWHCTNPRVPYRHTNPSDPAPRPA